MLLVRARALFGFTNNRACDGVCHGMHSIGPFNFETLNIGPAEEPRVEVIGVSCPLLSIYRFPNRYERTTRATMLKSLVSVEETEVI